MSEWTPLTGLRRAAGRVLLRAIVAVIILAPLIWLATPLLNQFPAHWAIFLVFGGLAVFLGLALGTGLGAGVTEIAGLTSIVLTVVVLAFAIGALVLAAGLSGLSRPLGDWQAFIVLGGASLGAAVSIVRATLLDT